MTWTRTCRPLLLLCVIVASGCRQQPAAQATTSTLPTVAMSLGSRAFTLEVANTAETREYGLMRRDSMPADHGMIFVFDRPQKLGFYMKNTRIPLDIVFVAEDGAIISIKQMKPYDLTTTWADGNAKWAIELNQGAASAAGLKVGDKIQIPESARAAEP